MQKRVGCRLVWLILGTFLGPLAAFAEERTERFDKDPHWDGLNNHLPTKPRTIRQNFGYSPTNHARSELGEKGEKGEMGGFITPAAEPAYYAKKLAPLTFNDRLTASGKLACGERFHVLLGFFNAGSVNEWRTPNALSIRLSGRGDVFYAYVEYATQHWRAGGDHPQPFAIIRDPKSGKRHPQGFPRPGTHSWSLTYDPDGNGGAGSIAVTIDGVTSICHLSAGHKSDGATFNRFGLLNVMKSADNGGEVWLGDVTINGEKQSFALDPVWDGFQNRRTYETTNIRPRFDFGFSPTRFAGGQAGEMGGLVFRGDCRYPERLAYYGDRLAELTVAKPLQASGKVALRRGVTDSTTLLGFFHSKDSVAVNPSQANGVPRNFLGVAVEGPSREGFCFYPLHRLGGNPPRNATPARAPHIFPDGKPHDWSLLYDPRSGAEKGAITVSLDGQSIPLDVSKADQAAGARFDRFGLVTTWIDGNGQQVYFDDLTYTSKQE